MSMFLLMLLLLFVLVLLVRLCCHLLFLFGFLAIMLGLRLVGLFLQCLIGIRVLLCILLLDLEFCLLQISMFLRSVHLLYLLLHLFYRSFGIPIFHLLQVLLFLLVELGLLLLHLFYLLEQLVIEF